MRAALLLLVLLAACSADTPANEDAGSDAGIDAGTDAGFDAGADPGVDAGTDAGQDAGSDAGSDSGDQGEPELWSWCPEPSAYVGGEWDATLRVTDQALYCGLFDMSRTIQQEHDTKAQLRLVPGDYPLPNQPGSYPIRLPVCLKFREPGTQPEIQQEGILRLEDNGSFFAMELEQPLISAQGETYYLCAWLNGPPQALSSPLELNGDFVHPLTGYIFREFRLRRDGCLSHLDELDFDSCHYDGVEEGHHTVVFSGGEIELFVRISMVEATRYARFVLANGTLDSVSFEQTDYWKLVFRPGMHFFVRDFLVLFDSPVSGACGLKIEGLDPGLEAPFGRLTTVDCTLSEIEELPIISEDFEQY